MLPPDYREGRSRNLHLPRPNADFKWSSPAVEARSPERPLSVQSGDLRWDARQWARRAVSGHSFLPGRVRCLTAQKARLAIAQGRQLALGCQPCQPAERVEAPATKGS